MRRLLIILLLLTPMTVSAQESSSGGPLFMKDMLDGREFFDPWGIGVDIFTMQQGYGIVDLDFQLPGVEIGDVSLIDVTNDVQSYDVKFDVWLTPFLNVFGLVGRMDADTYVDFSNLPIQGLPFPLGAVQVSYDGTVYGAGVNLMYGTDNWFVALNNTWTDASLSGDFDSSVSAYTAQPRIGLIRKDWVFYAGGMYLDTQEQHDGTIQLPIPGLPPIPFSVELESSEHWNYALGAMYVFSPKAQFLLEVGFGQGVDDLAAKKAPSPTRRVECQEDLQIGTSAYVPVGRRREVALPVELPQAQCGVLTCREHPASVDTDGDGFY